MGKEKYECVSPEDVDLGTWYALTINPNDDSQCFGENECQRPKAFMELMTPLLYKTLQVDDYKLVMEISKGSRLHFHGWCKWDTLSTLKTFFLKIRKLQGICTYAIKPLDDTGISDKYKNWQDYVYKQKWIWKNEYRCCFGMKEFTNKEAKRCNLLKLLTIETL